MSERTESGTRLSLLSRARLEDSQAWNELVELYGPLVAHWCRRCGLPDSLVADCVQEVFLAVSRALDTFAPKRNNGAFRAWLWTITSNKVKDTFRRQHPDQAGGGSTALIQIQNVAEDSAIPEDEPTSSNQLEQLVARGLQQVRCEFEPRTWEVFERAVVEQITTSVVAQEFGISAAAVRQTRSRILRRLRQQLGDLAE